MGSDTSNYCYICDMKDEQMLNLCLVEMEDPQWLAYKEDDGNLHGRFMQIKNCINPSSRW